jgi:hypothetical protein
MMTDVIPPCDARREQSLSRRSIVPFVCLLLFTAVICTGCTSSRSAEIKRPSVYRGGQYYGDAVHSYDLASQ